MKLWCPCNTHVVHFLKHTNALVLQKCLISQNYIKLQQDYISLFGQNGKSFVDGY